MRNKRYVLFFCLLGLLYASVEYSTDHHEVLTTTVVDRSFQDNASEVSGRIQASSIEYYDRDTHDMYRSTDICTRIDTPDRPDNMGRGVRSDYYLSLSKSFKIIMLQMMRDLFWRKGPAILNGYPVFRTVERHSYLHH